MKLYPVDFYHFWPLARVAVEIAEERKLHLKSPGRKEVLEVGGELFERLTSRSGGQLDRALLDDACFQIEDVSDYAWWWCCGKQIFHFPDSVVAAFLRTDIDDVPTNLIRPPYKALYLKFGLEHSFIETVPGVFIDGAFVYTMDDGSLLIETTGVGQGDRHFGVSIPLEMSAPTLGDALEAGITRMRKRAGKSSSTTEQLAFETGISLTGISAEQLSINAAEQAARAVDSASALGRRILRLTANALAFILFERSELPTTYLGAPESMLKKLERSPSEKHRKRNIAKLWSLGFTKVHLCGASSDYEKSAPTGREVSTHWRRGHWRLQPHGPGFTLLRLRWIRPVIVRRDKGEPAAGHIYEAPDQIA